MAKRIHRPGFEPKRPTLSRALRHQIFARDGWQCWFCGKSVEPTKHGESGKGCAATLEHLHPVNKGGDDAEANLVTACRICNCQKGARTIEEYRAYLRYVVNPSGRAIAHLRSVLELAPKHAPILQQMIEDMEFEIGATRFHGEAKL